MITKTFSATLDGIQGALVQIEAISLNSLPQILVTGLPGEVVKESRERVRACLVNLGFDLPSGKIIVHLSPANIKKQGSHYDLAIALAVLSAESKLIETRLEEMGFVGELSLEGRLCPVKGALPLIEVLTRKPAIKKIIIPKENEKEGALLQSSKIYLAEDLGEIIDFLKGRKDLPQCSNSKFVTSDSSRNIFDQVKGQPLAKRALQIAMAGRHHLLLVGPPGVGKSMLSASALGLMPLLTQDEFIEVLKIYSASTVEIDDLFSNRERPYRAPHPSVSASALLGGGAGTVIPGEVSLAHHGILFMDEFPEYRRDALEGLREPLQSGSLHLNRVGRTLSLPAQFTLIAAMNPCPCGMYSQADNRCRCTSEKKAQYRKKLSTPILDRMALMVQMNPADLSQDFSAEQICFSEVKDSIARTYEIQTQRIKNAGSDGDREINLQSSDFNLSSEIEDCLKQYQKQTRISFRRTNQIIRVSRTIADLEGRKMIELSHFREAWSLRCFDFYQIS